MRLLSKNNNNNKGTMMIVYALALTTLLGFCAIVTDIGVVTIEKDKFQTAIDATSLAAAQVLPDTDEATAVANEYIVLNGYTADDISVEFSNSDKTLSITGTKVIPFYFARVLGFKETTIHPTATAESGTMGGAFDYVLFSGSTTTLLKTTGNNATIDGNTHTNKNFQSNGANLTITGACEAMTTVTTNGSNASIGTRVPYAAYVGMPDFSAELIAMAQASGECYTGDKLFSGSNITVDEPIYIDGNLTVNGSNFKGSGCVLVSGNITFNGNNLNSSSTDAICFYSQNGNITINGSSINIDGILYAPKGKVTL
ncbi:MAG: hypothetical protein HGA22_01740, partial [Clostridiales bacterium]|nr:hypothetical protein [Clostridiales bacterium]